MQSLLPPGCQTEGILYLHDFDIVMHSKGCMSPTYWRHPTIIEDLHGIVLC